MSGAFGWHKSSYQNSKSVHDSYREAKQEYQPNVGKVTIKHIDSNSPPSVKRKLNEEKSKIINYPDAKHTLKSNAANVIIVVQDVTSSMQTWPQEIFKRLPLLYHEACEYLESEDLEILFICHGDVRTDNFPIQVSRFGKGQELDEILSNFYMKCHGGGQGSESQEVVAYYLDKQVDLSSAQNVYTYFITDEAACDKIDPEHIRKYLGLFSVVTSTKDIFELLKSKTKIFTILCRTQNSNYNALDIKKFWEDLIGINNVIHLDDSRRVVDVMLGSIAKLTGQITNFTKNLMSRQQGNFSTENIQTVQKSISLIGENNISFPIKVKKPLI